jgi:hypothetical protein
VLCIIIIASYLLLLAVVLAISITISIIIITHYDDDDRGYASQHANIQQHTSTLIYDFSYLNLCYCHAAAGESMLHADDK